MTERDSHETVGPLLKVEKLRKYFPVAKSIFREAHDFVHAVDDISFEIAPGESLGLVGESGCGKSTTGRMLTKLEEATAGHIYLADEGEMIDIAEIQRSEMRRFRRRVQMIFQDPFESLNPRRTVYDTVAESLTVQRIGRVLVSARWGARWVPRKATRRNMANPMAQSTRFIMTDEIGRTSRGK